MPHLELCEMIKRHEGRRLYPYWDTTGHITIGYGRNLTDRGISENCAECMFEEDLLDAITTTRRVVPGFAGLSERRQHVLIDMMYNLGLVQFMGFKKMLAAIEAEDWSRAAAEMLDSEWALQVGQRAIELEAMMLKG